MTNARSPQHSTASPSRSGPEKVLVVAIVGGNRELLARLAAELPRGRGMAFIFMPAESAAAAPLRVDDLQGLTSLPVQQARQGLELAADHAYVAAPNQLLTCTERTLQVSDVGAVTLPIDRLLRSLAKHHGERAVAILLSGVRSDGSIGAAELKAAGGLVVLQSPASGAEATSPEHQLLSRGADLVTPAPRIMDALRHYFPASPHKPEPAWPAPFDYQVLLPILSVLSEVTGHDFTRYKRSTVSRRVQRRMRVHVLEDPAAYAELLRAQPAEAELLFAELLIGVTSFFRDPEVFDALERAMGEYLERLPARQDLRVWVPACSTGEEAYSLAILLQECAQRANKGHALKVFATDVDTKAIEFARTGRYPLGISEYVSPERLERFFVLEDDTYRINKETRERIIFAPHNVSRDPPFTHMNLVSCRNLLIYLEPELQQQVLTLFEYALEPGGLLLLGASESVGAMQSTFELLDRKHKLFVHRPSHPRRGFALPLEQPWSDRSARREERHLPRPRARQSAAGAAEQLLLSEFAPPSAIVSPSGELAYIHGRTGRFLEPAIGEPSSNIFDMAREGLQLELPAALRAAQHTDEPVVRRGLQVRTNGSVERVTLSVKPLHQPESLNGLLLVSFEIEKEPVERPEALSSQQTSNLEAELHYVRSTLQGMIEDLESSNEELKSMNEELQSTNEEVQSSNEELSTSREELQSLNEELQTLNEELAERNTMLSQSNDDMYNLLSSIHVATVFVDPQLNVKRFTAPARTVFRLRDSDIGRPVSDLVMNLDYQTLVEDAQEVLRSLVFAEREVQTLDGEWRLMRILPYRTANNVIDGLIITVTDIQKQKRAEHEMQAARGLLEDTLARLPAPVVLLGEGFEIAAASAEFARRFGTAEPHLLGKPLSALAPAWGHPAVMERLSSLARGEPGLVFRLRGQLGARVPLDVLVHPARLRGAHPQARYVLAVQELTNELPPPLNLD